MDCYCENDQCSSRSDATHPPDFARHTEQERVSPIPVRPVGGCLTEPTRAVQPCRKNGSSWPLADICPDCDEVWTSRPDRNPANSVRRRSPPVMRRRDIGAGRRQMGRAAHPLPDEFLRKGPRGPHRQPGCGLEWPRRVDAKGAGISHVRLLRAEWSPSLAENGGNKRVRWVGRINRQRRSSIAP